MATLIDAVRKEPMSEDYRKAGPGQPNVGPWERWASLGAGVGLLATMVVKRSPGAMLAGLVGGGLLYRGASGQCAVYHALGKHGVQARNPAIGVSAKQSVRFDRSLTIARPAAEIYKFWRDLSRLPSLIDHLESVIEDASLSHWTASGPMGLKMEWDAQIVEDRPAELLVWRSLAGSAVDTAGSLRLQELPHGRGTAVRLVMKYDSPGGRTGSALAAWLGTDVEQELFEGLRRMKRLLEAGELPTNEGQPKGRCGG